MRFVSSVTLPRSEITERVKTSKSYLVNPCCIQWMVAMQRTEYPPLNSLSAPAPGSDDAPQVLPGAATESSRLLPGPAEADTVQETSAHQHLHRYLHQQHLSCHQRCRVGGLLVASFPGSHSGFAGDSSVIANLITESNSMFYIVSL